MKINPGKVKFKVIIHSALDFKLNPWRSFLKGLEKFSHPESHYKISNLMITELLYLRILDGYDQRFPWKFQAYAPVCF